jgi:hypothetical protein
LSNFSVEVTKPSAAKDAYGQGWLSNAPPSASAFAPLAGGLGHYTELRGAAVITNRVEVDLAPGLVDKAVRNAISAGGNLRADVSMSPSSILPR